MKKSSDDAKVIYGVAESGPMAYTFTPLGRAERTHRGRRQLGDLAISSYTAGGEPLTAAPFQIRTLEGITPQGVTSNGYSLRFDAATGKIHALKASVGGLITEIVPDALGGVFAPVTADAAATVLNGAAVMALTDATVTTAGGLAHAAGKVTGLTNPETLDDGACAGRNVVIVQNQNGAAGTWTAGWARVIGLASDGSALTEDIALQTDEIADTKFRSTPGTKAFGTVTSVRLLNSAKTAAQAGPASSRLSVGIGTIFGLRGKIAAETDIKSVRKDTAAIARATYVATTSPSQIDMGADVADDVELTISYDAVASSTAGREAAAAENIGTVRVEAIGT